MITILLADDNRHLREYCQGELEDEGYQVVVARDGAEAVRLAGLQPPDIAVLDIHMPGIDGLEAARRIRGLHPEVPIVFFTSFDEACLHDERSRFATACVEKREDLADLKRTIVTVLASRRQGVPYRLGLSPIHLEPARSS